MADNQRSSSAAVCSAVAEDQRLAQSKPENGKSGNGKSGNGKAGNGKTEHRLVRPDSHSEDTHSVAVTWQMQQIAEYGCHLVYYKMPVSSAPTLFWQVACYTSRELKSWSCTPSCPLCLIQQGYADKHADT